jgi:hypothetical protein
MQPIELSGTDQEIGDCRGVDFDLQYHATSGLTRLIPAHAFGGVAAMAPLRTCDAGGAGCALPVRQSCCCAPWAISNP